jgi:tryptophanyl-tRNA synthetase
MENEIMRDNVELVEKFNAEPISKVKGLPDFYTFNNGLIYSHRDFDKFMERLKKGEPSAIVSGLNASGTIHIGHKAVFDTNLFFQRKYGVPVFIPISDDESYVSKKVESQEEAFKNAKLLAKDMLALGFDPKNTFIIIDQIFTNIYNLAIKLSRHITMSEVKAIYGYKNEENVGLHFYPAVQSAHVVLPFELKKISNILVPIGPDEDAHLRAARDMAARCGYPKPAVVHSKFMPGVDGQKMSKSKNNAIFYHDSEAEIKKKVTIAFSGGAKTIEEHKKSGGNPEIDVACLYLAGYFLNKDEGERLFNDYRSGKLLSGDVKKMLLKSLLIDIGNFKNAFEKLTEKEVESALLKNER